MFLKISPRLNEWYQQLVSDKMILKLDPNDDLFFILIIFDMIILEIFVDNFKLLTHLKFLKKKIEV